jgi:hypothetical protein
MRLTEASFMLVATVLGPDSSSLRVASSAEPEQHGRNDNGIRLYRVSFYETCVSRHKEVSNLLSASAPHAQRAQRRKEWKGGTAKLKTYFTGS